MESFTIYISVTSFLWSSIHLLFVCLLHQILSQLFTTPHGDKSTIWPTLNSAFIPQSSVPQFSVPQFLSLQHSLRSVSCSHWHQFLLETPTGTSYCVWYCQDLVHHPHCQLRSHWAQPHSHRQHSHTIPLTIRRWHHQLNWSHLYKYRLS